MFRPIQKAQQGAFGPYVEREFIAQEERLSEYPKTGYMYENTLCLDHFSILVLIIERRGVPMNALAYHIIDLSW